MTSPSINEHELHAYADGQLDAARAEQISAWLADQGNGAALEQVRSWRAQSAALRGLHRQVLDEPLPAALVLAAQGRPPVANAPAWRRHAGALLLLVVGTGLGWTLHGLAGLGGGSRAAAAPQSLVRLAAVAHNVYSSDVRRPVEIGADQEQALVTWLSRRMGAAVRAPRLAPLGFELIGGRLLPGQSGPVAQFMYQDTGGQRLTLYVSRDQVQNQGTGFRFASEGQLNVFYWIDGRFGYALSGSVAKGELSRIASAVYDQLEPAPGGE